MPNDQASIQRIAALETKVRSLQAASSQTTQVTPTSSAAAASSGGYWTWLSTPYVVDLNDVSARNPVGAGTWNTLNVTSSSAAIPTTARELLLWLQGRRDKAAGGFAGVYYRSPSSTGQTYTVYAQSSINTDTDTEGWTGQAVVPITNGTFDWYKDQYVFYFTFQILAWR